MTISYDLPRRWRWDDPAGLTETRMWMDPCQRCGAEVTGFDAEPVTVIENPYSVIRIPDPGCPWEEDGGADCTCTAVPNPAPDPAFNEERVVGYTYTMRPCGCTAYSIRIYKETRPVPGTEQNREK